MECNELGLAFNQVDSKPGFWNVKAWYSTDPQQERFRVIKCAELSEEVCLGGDDRLANGRTCRKGHTGPLCSTCKEDWQLGSDGLCEFCGGGGSLSHGLIALLCVSIAVVAGAAAVMAKRKGDVIKGKAKEYKDKILSYKAVRVIRAINWKGLALKLKIMLGLFQVTTTMTINFDVAWPRAFSNMQEGFAFVNVDLPNMGCHVGLNYVDKFLSAVLAPIAVGMPFAIGFVVFGALFKASKRPRLVEDGGLDMLLRARNNSLKVVIYMLFLVYTSTSNTILRMFDCMPLENGKSYLKADFSIECGSATVHTRAFGSAHSFDWYRGWAVVAAFIYPLGVPVFFFFVLWLNRKQLFVEGSDEPTAELEDEMGFLYGGYRKDLWWWECVELLRKLVLTGIIAIYKPGSPEQLFLAIVLAVTFIVGYARMNPYADASGSDLQLVCQLQIFFLSITAFALQLTALAAASSSSGHREDSFSSSSFETVLMLMATAPLVMATLQVGFVLAREYRHAAAALEEPQVGQKKPKKDESVAPGANPLGLDAKTMGILGKNADGGTASGGAGPLAKGVPRTKVLL